MNVNNIFHSVQGEGRYAGHPAVFVRLSGCNLDCEWCDTDFEEYDELSPEEVSEKLNDYNSSLLVFTGGEPCIQLNEVLKVFPYTNKQKHLETNGTILKPDLTRFDYISFSPKSVRTAEEIHEFIRNYKVDKVCEYDIKVVTDGEMNKNLIPYATMLMPLTTFKYEEDKKIKKKVWELCKEHQLKYSPRLQIDLFGDQGGV